MVEANNPLEAAVRIEIAAKRLKESMVSYAWIMRKLALLHGTGTRTSNDSKPTILWLEHDGHRESLQLDVLTPVAADCLVLEAVANSYFAMMLESGQKLQNEAAAVMGVLTAAAVIAAKPAAELMTADQEPELEEVED